MRDAHGVAGWWSMKRRTPVVSTAEAAGIPPTRSKLNLTRIRGRKRQIELREAGIRDRGGPPARKWTPEEILAKFPNGEYPDQEFPHAHEVKKP